LGRQLQERRRPLVRQQLEQLEWQQLVQLLEWRQLGQLLE